MCAYHPKSEPHVKTILLSSDDGRLPFEKPIVHYIPTFPYCKNGFDYEYLRVMISNYPLYDSDDTNKSFIPSSTSGICYGYIYKDDFLNMKKLRVPIFIDYKQTNSMIKKYINFDDIHDLKPDLFVENQLSLAKISRKTFYKVKTIESEINERLKKRFNILRKDQLFSLIKLKRIQNNLQHVSYAYYYAKSIQGERFIVHNNQIFTAFEECYTEEYFNSSLFKNSSRMNYSVCGLDEENKEPPNKADVIFSTFVNFECFYLKMIELCPGYVESYFTKCGLLIDEADSILIDEIANGTIVSRAMKSNATEILKFVYVKKQEGLNYDQTFSLIKENPDWASCNDLTKEHIKQMYKEIELVHTPEYSNGMKYCIETKVVTKAKKKNRLIQEALNLSKKYCYKYCKRLC